MATTVCYSQRSAASVVRERSAPVSGDLEKGEFVRQIWSCAPLVSMQCELLQESCKLMLFVTYAKFAELSMATLQ